MNCKMKLLFFIANLRIGGAERRLIELLTKLKSKDNYEILLILAHNHIDYHYFYDLGIQYTSIDKKPESKDPTVFFQLDNIVKKFKPDNIHTWGSMQTFYMVPIAYLRKIPLINSQITDSIPIIKKLSFQNFFNKINFLFSDLILANSFAGLKAYKVDNNSKSKVIYNGFDFSRIENLTVSSEIRRNFDITSKYVVGMVASFSEYKDYKTFIQAALFILNQRTDVTFLCIGGGNDVPYKKMVQENHKENILFLGSQKNVESIMNLCDIGVLSSTYTEGISNSILEFMALGKPVIANKGGGTNELVLDRESGFLITPQSPKELSEKILNLLENYGKRQKMGKAGVKRIKNEFCLDRMTDQFVKYYNKMV